MAAAMSSEAPPVFAAFQGAAVQNGLFRRRLGLTAAVSVGLHAVLLVGVAAGVFARPAVPAQPPPAPLVKVSLGRPAPPRRAPDPPAAPQPPPPRPSKVRPLLAAVQPTPPQPMPSTIDPTEVEEGTAEGSDEDAGAHEGPVGELAGATPAPPPPPVAPPPPALTPEQRRQSLARYLQQALRPRIDSRFVYPPAAEREGVEGTVLLRLTIDCGGRLLSAVTVGACPADLLCEHARDTTRQASPFPAPPRELGGTIQVDLPIAYRLN